MSDEQHAEWFEARSKELVALFDDGFQASKDIPAATKIAMEAAEKLQGVSGEEKEKLVIELLCKLIDNTDMEWIPDPVIDPILKRVLREIGPGFLRLICGASKGELALNKTDES